MIYLFKDLTNECHDKIPYGILRKVTAKNTRNGTLHIDTEEASLEEAIENAVNQETTKVFLCVE